MDLHCKFNGAQSENCISALRGERPRSVPISPSKFSPDRSCSPDRTGALIYVCEGMTTVHALTKILILNWSFYVLKAHNEAGIYTAKLIIE